MTEMEMNGRPPQKSPQRQSSMLSRRAFLGNVAVGVGGLFCADFAQGEVENSSTDARSRVVIVRNPAVIADNKVSGEAAGEMVHRAVCMLTGKTDREQAWKVLFSAKERVAMG